MEEIFFFVVYGMSDDFELEGWGKDFVVFVIFESDLMKCLEYNVEIKSEKVWVFFSVEIVKVSRCDEGK